MTRHKPTGIAQAVAAMTSQAALAQALSEPCTQQAVSAWLAKGYVPTSRVSDIHRLTRVPKRDLVSPRLREIARWK
jgi:hypothetical protein